jgi:hypothetical protein
LLVDSLCHREEPSSIDHIVSLHTSLDDVEGEHAAPVGRSGAGSSENCEPSRGR